MINLGSSQHVARKRHFCDSCGRSIEPGQLYHRARIVDGGDAWVWKAHEACQAAGEALWRHDIEGDDGCIRNVSDMDREDREWLRERHPEIHAAIWGHIKEVI